MENKIYPQERICIICGDVNSHTICKYCAAKLKESEGIEFIGE